MVEKEHMNLAMIGHIDHGKSTLLGRLLMDSGAKSDIRVCMGNGLVER
jgi:translation elongation factor EF-1alpha